MGLDGQAPLWEVRRVRAERGPMKTRVVHFLVDRAFIESREASEILEPAWWAEGRARTGSRTAGVHHRLHPSQSRCCALINYIEEVRNGGHLQFFTNPWTETWEDAREGLDMLGLTELSAILSEAVRRVGGTPPLDVDERNALVQVHDPDFDDLDESVYRLLESQDIDEAMLSFMRAHPDQFTFEGVVSILVLPDSTPEDERDKGD